MVIALDGATWALARPWMEAGHMPHLQQLVSDGVYADMRAELPPSSVPNWPAFMTGKNAGKHGCVWWLKRDSAGRLDRIPIDARSVEGDTLWSYLSSLGKRVIVQNVPVTYPVEPVNGVLISGLLTPRTAQDFVYPPELKAEVDRAVGGYRVYPRGNYARGREQIFLDALIGNIQQHTQAADYLLKTQPWDFFILVLGPTDEGAHKYWHYQDPQHHLYKASEAAKFGDSLQKLYMAADAAIGQLRQNLGPNDTLIVMSDHGFGPVERFFLPNNWLLQKGLLKLKANGPTPLKRLLFNLGFTPRNLYPMGKQVLAFLRGSNALRQRLDPIRQGRSALRKVFLSEEDIDWTRTRAYASGFLFSQIHLNLQGRDPQGIVTPADYEALRDQLIAELAQVINPATGQPHYQRVYKREELYSGPQVANIADLIGHPADFRTVDAGMDFRSNKLFETDAAISGTHRVEGIFALAGPGVAGRGQALPPIRIYDLAPTILYCLGVPVPEDMDGQVIEAAFASEILQARPRQFASARNARSGGDFAFSDEEAQLVQNRLRDLGYLS